MAVALPVLLALIVSAAAVDLYPHQQQTVRFVPNLDTFDPSAPAVAPIEPFAPPSSVVAPHPQEHPPHEPIDLTHNPQRTAIDIGGAEPTTVQTETADWPNANPQSAPNLLLQPHVKPAARPAEPTAQPTPTPAPAPATQPPTKPATPERVKPVKPMLTPGVPDTTATPPAPKQEAAAPQAEAAAAADTAPVTPPPTLQQLMEAATEAEAVLRVDKSASTVLGVIRSYEAVTTRVAAALSTLDAGSHVPDSDRALSKAEVIGFGQRAWTAISSHYTQLRQWIPAVKAALELVALDARNDRSLSILIARAERAQWLDHAKFGRILQQLNPQLLASTGAGAGAAAKNTDSGWDIDVSSQVGYAYKYLGLYEATIQLLKPVIEHITSDRAGGSGGGGSAATHSEEAHNALMTRVRTRSSREQLAAAKAFSQYGAALQRLSQGKRPEYDREALRVAIRSGLEGKLRAKPFWTAAESGYEKSVAALESNWSVIQSEMAALLDAEDQPASKSHKRFQTEVEGLRDWTAGTGNWRKLRLWSGTTELTACGLCPKTCAIIKSMREATGGKFGEIEFSVLDPNTHIHSHCGHTNERLRMHLGLECPPGARIRVANETRSFTAGKVLIFDDSFEHEVWHDQSPKRRVVLKIDVKHPDLPWE